MRIDYAIEREWDMEISHDGYRFFCGEKYTIIEMGYAVYILLDDHTPESERWILQNGDTRPAGSAAPVALCRSPPQL